MANTLSPQSQSQTQSQKNRSMNGVQDRSAKSEMNKSPDIGKDAQVKVDEVFSQATQYFDVVKTYLRESPREAFGLGLTVAAVGWALLFTKPGRQIFDKGANAFGPQLSKSISDLFSGN